MRLLKVFLCHSSGDKLAVRELYQKLAAEGWIDPWLDEEKLYPGQDWDMEIEKAVEETHAVIVCLSNHSVTKEGYVQHELRLILNMADYKPEGTLFIIPIRLDDCPLPRRLKMWHCVDFFERSDWAYGRLLHSLTMRANTLGIQAEKSQQKPGPVKSTTKPKIEPKREAIAERISKAVPSIAVPKSILEIGLTKAEWGGVEFVKVPAGPFLMGSQKGNKRAFDAEMPQHTVNIPYDYWMARFPVTNEQYAAYVGEGKHPVSDWRRKNNHPVVDVSWKDAMAYCQWLTNLLEGRLPEGLVLRLPTEAEWEKAARGADGREWPWGDEFDKSNCNTAEGGKGGTTPVGMYSPQGDSPYGCADMVGNVWEWTHTLFQAYPYKADDGRESEADPGRRVVRGGSFVSNDRFARCACRYVNLNFSLHNGGFRVVASPVSPEK